jgi:Kef-type K+ transport system membrane component KefB
MPNSPDQLLLELFLIFLSAKVIGEIFERVNMPGVLGEILAGVAFGPWALAWIHASDTVNSIAEIGAIFVLFSAGLETSASDLIRVGRKALLVATAGVIAPFVLGFFYMRLRGEGSAEAIFVAAAMVATSVGITARVLADLRVLSHDTAKIILGAAVFDDILGMVLLAVIGGVASGHGPAWLHLGVLLTEAAAFALFMIFVAPKIVPHIHPRMERLSTQNAALVVVLAICLFFSWLASMIGIAAIVGAFFAGLMFADYAPRMNLLPKVSGITDFLAPYFFFTIGAHLNLHLFNREVLLDAAIISLLAIISKVIGCGLPMLRDGWPSVLRVGIGMMPRGEVALIIALVGLQAKLMEQSAYAIVVFMTAATTLLAPPILRSLYRSDMEEKPASVRL